MGVCRTYNNGLRILATVLALIATASNANAQSAALVANAKQQFFSATGAPLAGGFVYSYVPGTTVTKTTWSDQNEQFPNSQPVVLDSGGFAPPIFGQGNYRQILKDANNNLIWDGFTSAYGSSVPSGANGTDTAPVGSVMPFSGFTIPTNWQLAYGQALSRTTFATLLAAITIQTTTGNCISTSTTVSGFASTAQIPVGSAIESSCLPTGTTVASIINSSTVSVSQAATATGSFTVTDFPWGNGDGATTFNVPDLRGRTFAGADCLGSTLQSGAGCAGRLTAATNSGNSTNFGGTGAQVPGLAGGSQNVVVKQPNLPNVTFAATGSISVPNISGPVGLVVSSGTINFTSGSDVGSSAYSASWPSGYLNNLGALSGGTNTPLGTVQPTLTVNYIIKVAPNTTGGGGVTSFGGMFGDIICGAAFTCAPVASVNEINCNPATISILGCIIPDNTSVTINGSGVISAHVTAGAAVTSVNVALPTNTFTNPASPITSTGTLTVTYNTQTANTFLAGPTTGSAASPTWRALVSADIPTTLSGNYTFGGSITAPSLTTSGTIAGSICATSAGLILYIAGTNCETTAATSIAPGTTTISPSNNGYVLTDNSGVLAETAPTGTGSVVFSASPALTGNVTLGSSGSAGTIALGNATSGTVKLQTVTGALGSAVASLPANTGTLAETNLAQSWTAAQTFTNSDIILLGSSTGGTTFTSANASASNFTITVPAATDTMELIGTNATITGTRTYSAFATFNGGIAVSRLNCTTPSCSPTSAQYYICAVTSGGVIQVNLPGSPTTNELHLIKDCTGNDQTNNITINATGSTIDGQVTYTMKTSTTGAGNNKFDSVGVIFDSVNGWMLN